MHSLFPTEINGTKVLTFGWILSSYQIQIADKCQNGATYIRKWKEYHLEIQFGKISPTTFGGGHNMYVFVCKCQKPPSQEWKTDCLVAKENLVIIEI